MQIQSLPHLRTGKVNVTQKEFHFARDTRRSHAAEAIKDPDDLWGIKDMLLSKGRLRDHCLFVLGVNYGLRCGDLCSLRVGDVITPNGTVRDSVLLREEKTTKYRTVYNNEITEDALIRYLADKEIDLDDYLFVSESSNAEWREAGWEAPKPLTVRSVDRILKKIVNDEYGLDIHASTHMLRKTFGYQALIQAPDRNRGLELVQTLLNHSSPQITLRYIGITDQELRSVYKNLNLGQKKEREPMDILYTSGLYLLEGGAA